VSRRLALLALAIFWAAVGWGVAQAAGASLADPNPYLERHGLSAALVPYQEVAPADLAGTPLDASVPGEATFSIGYAAVRGFYSPPGGACHRLGKVADPDCPPGTGFTPAGVWIQADLEPAEKVQVVAHEWGHAVSAPAWEDIHCGLTPGYCTEAFGDLYEEGLAEAWALHHFPGMWRWLLGKRLRAERIAEVREFPSYDEASLWLRAADRATPGGRWSREAREFLNGLLRSDLHTRMDALQASTGGTTS
jgi:hypothetical protein